MTKTICLALVRLASEKDLLREVEDSIQIIESDPIAKRPLCAAFRERLDAFASSDPAWAEALYPVLLRDLANAATWKRWLPAWGLAATLELLISRKGTART